ncbi:MAG: NAD-dependent deacetylase [Spirochaetaceae bacterium]|jgi:NAD-dependent deacetylase|nr:NAD-dependent deacetylase [Spirochaetaceae bacterium]
MNADIQTLCAKIRGAKHCTALTGAGVSTLSGIRDFRGKNGLYNDMDAEKIFDIDYFERDPKFYYNKAKDFIYNIDEKPASIVHTTLALLERKGWLKALITQNIDVLHQKGGSKRVIEVHGSPAVHYCLRCAGVRAGFDEVAAKVKAGDYPECPHCGGILKPAITFFGEMLPADALRDAEYEAAASDLMLVLGTSLTVNPAASIPRVTLNRGGEIVIVNNQPTPLDRSAVMHFDDLAEVFEGIAEVVGSGCID